LIPRGKKPKGNRRAPCATLMSGPVESSRLFGLRAYPTPTNNACKMACRMPPPTSSG
jgi:hypothetical protein